MRASQDSLPSLPAVKLSRICAWQSVVQHVFNCESNLRASLCFLSPVENKCRLYFLKKLPGDFFHLFSLLSSKVGAGPRKDVEHCQFIFRQLLPNMALL